jgi:hypothetical protein
MTEYEVVRKARETKMALSKQQKAIVKAAKQMADHLGYHINFGSDVNHKGERSVVVHYSDTNIYGDTLTWVYARYGKKGGVINAYASRFGKETTKKRARRMARSLKDLASAYRTALYVEREEAAREKKIIDFNAAQAEKRSIEQKQAFINRLHCF